MIHMTNLKSILVFVSLIIVSAITYFSMHIIAHCIKHLANEDKSKNV